MNKKKAMSNREEKKKPLPPDVLKRGDYVEMVRQVIENKIDNKAGYSLAIDGQWGSGKTYVLQMLEKQLETRALIFHYNAWERDYYDEPLMALVSVLLERLKEEAEKKTEKSSLISGKEAKEILLSIGRVVSVFLESKIGFNLADVIKETNRAVENSNSKSFQSSDKWQPLSDGVRELHEILTDLSEKRPVVLIVDELDRCLPEYAVKVLERLHHNVFYGTPAKEEEVRPFFEKYMTKFVDIVIPLSFGRTDSDAENLLMGLDKEYIPFFYHKMIFDGYFLSSCISQIMEEIPRRDQEKIFKQVKLCHELAVNWSAKCAPRLQGVQLDSFHYGVLVYEILTAVSIYYLGNKERFGVVASVPVRIRLDVSEKTPIERKIGQIFRLDNCFTQDSTQAAWKLLVDMGKPVSVILAYFLETEKVEYIDLFYASSFSERIRQTTLFLRVFESVMKILSGDENESDFMYDLKEECEHSTGHLPKTSDIF